MHFVSPNSLRQKQFWRTLIQKQEKSNRTAADKQVLRIELKNVIVNACR